jgi:glycerol-3-phosphate O-acyltransferase
LFEVVVTAYIFALLDENFLLSLFIERNKSRSGKIQMPSEPVFNSIVKNYI